MGVLYLFIFEKRAMNSKKLGVYSITFLIVMPLMASLVNADSITKGWEVFGKFGSILRYIFGDVPSIQYTTSEFSAMIITIAVWLLITITLGVFLSAAFPDNKWAPWAAAVIIGIIAANLNWISAAIAWLTGIFAFLGVAALYVGLGAAFVAFIAVNLGIRKLAVWLQNRRTMMHIERGKAKLRAGTKGLLEVGEEMLGEGEKF